MVWVAATETTGVQCPMKVVTDFSSKHFYCFKDPPTIPRLQKCFGAKELKDEQAVVRIERLAQSLDPGRERISAIIDTIPCQRPVATADASTTAAAMLLVREQILVGNDYDVNRSRPFSQRWRDLARSSCGEGDIADDPLPSMAVPVVVAGSIPGRGIFIGHKRELCVGTFFFLPIAIRKEKKRKCIVLAKNRKMEK